MPKSVNPVNWSEIPTNNINDAKVFYENILGYHLELSEMGDTKLAWFPMQPDGSGATGSLVQGEGLSPSHNGSMVYFSVDAIEPVLAKVVDAGGKVEVPVTDIGEFGFFAHVSDPEGNRIGLHMDG